MRAWRTGCLGSALSITLSLVAGLGGCDGERPVARIPARSSAPGTTTSAPPARALDVRWVGDADGDAPLVVLLHGFGAPGDDLVPLARTLRDRLEEPPRFVLPAAPIALGGAGRAWWPIDDFGRDRPADRGDEAPDGLLEARRDVLALLERLRADGRLDPARTVLGGFSQGAMLAADVALAHDPPLGGLVMLSGGPVDEARWRRRMRERAMPVFVSHGRQDPLLSFAAAERLRDDLAGRGSDVTFVPFDGGHTIPAPVIAALAEFLAAR